MVSRDTVQTCYRLILGREAESEDVIEGKCRASDTASLIMDMVASREFLSNNVVAIEAGLARAKQLKPT